MKNYQLIVEEKETGKTTYLYNEVERLISEGFGVIILDSATEHEEKSLLRKIIKNHSDAIVINMCDKEQIALKNTNVKDFILNFTEYFPYIDLLENQDKIICFDLSYFLEKGHEIFDETNDEFLYAYYRNMYNDLSNQIVLMLILMEKYGILKNKFIIMDEIEFPITNYDIGQMQNELHFLASVHPENAFGTFYENFEKIKFQVFQRRKDDIK